jgi:hypothetical protein
MTTRRIADAMMDAPDKAPVRGLIDDNAVNLWHRVVSSNRSRLEAGPAEAVWAAGRTALDALGECRSHPA